MKGRKFRFQAPSRQTLDYVQQLEGLYLFWLRAWRLALRATPPDDHDRQLWEILRTADLRLLNEAVRDSEIAYRNAQIDMALRDVVRVVRPDPVRFEGTVQVSGPATLYEGPETEIQGAARASVYKRRAAEECEQERLEREKEIR